MKKSILFYALAASMTVLAGCQVEPVQQEEPAKVGTHKVSFTIDQSETKTVMDIRDGKSYFTWDEDDKVSVKVFENGVEADPEWMEVSLSDDKKVLSVLACFDETDPVPSSYRYDAYINSEVPASQTTQATTYDRRGDVIYAEPITMNAPAEDDLAFNFKRAVAISKMTLRGIGAGETIQSVVVKSTEQPLTGTFALDMENGSQPTWLNDGLELTVTGENLVADADGNCPIYFTTRPISDETLTVDVVTNAGSYTKTFGRITLSPEKVKSFGVTVAKKEDENLAFIKVTTEPTDFSGTYLIVSEDFGIALNSSVVARDMSKAANMLKVSPVDGVIAYTEELGNAVFEIAPYGSGYSLYSKGNQYIGHTSASNTGINGDANNPIVNSIAWSNGAVLISSIANKIIYTLAANPNPTSGIDDPLINYYKTIANTYKPIYLYKLVGDAPTPEVVHVESVELDKTTLELVVNETGTLSATVSPDNATNKAVTWESNNTSVATVANGVVTAVAPGEATITVRTVDGDKTATCAVTVTSNIKTLTSIQEINDEAMAAGSEKRDVYIKFDNWIVSGVNSSRAYVTDNEKGFVMYTKDHGFVAGDVLSGTVLCKVNKFELVASVEGVTKDNITVTKGGVVIPKYIATKNLAPVYTGVVVTYSGMVYDETTETLSKGEDVIVTNNTLYPGASFVDGHTYNVTGVFLRYLKKSGTETDPVTTPENDILPRSAADIVDLAPVKYNVTVQTVQNGSVTANPTTAAEGAVVTLTATPDSGYEFESWNVKNASTSALITVTDNKFTMPAANVNVSATFAEKEVESLKTMDEIFEAATSAGSTATDAKITFNNWVVSGVKNANAYVTDGTKGLIIYASGHGFAVGDILSGTVNCKVQLYNGASELVSLTSSTAGLTVTKGGSVTPQSIAITELSGVNTGAVITFEELTYNGTAFSDGANTITPYNTFMPLPALVSGKKYSVTGVYIQFKDTKEIAPRTNEDIVEKVAPKYAVTVASGITNGTVTVDYPQATEGQTVTITATANSGYKVKSVSAKKTASGTAITVTGNKFTMPAEAVTVSAEFEVNQDGEPVTVTWVAASDSDNPGNSVDWFSGDIDSNISWSATKGGSNNPKYYNTGSGLRVYSGGTFTVEAANGKKITKVVLTFSSGDYTFSTNMSTPHTENLDSVSSYTWNVSRTCRLQKVEVTYN